MPRPSWRATGWVRWSTRPWGCRSAMSRTRGCPHRPPERTRPASASRQPRRRRAPHGRGSVDRRASWPHHSGCSSADIDTRRHASRSGGEAHVTLATRGYAPREECWAMSDPKSSYGDPVDEPTDAERDADVVSRAREGLAEAEAARADVPAEPVSPESKIGRAHV